MMAPSEQQPMLLADEAGIDAPAPAPIRGGPAGWLRAAARPKCAAAAGLCLVAFLGAGAAMHGPGTAAAPSSGHAGAPSSGYVAGYFIGLAASGGLTFRDMSHECVTALKLLWAEEQGRTEEQAVCKAGQMAVSIAMNFSTDRHAIADHNSACFPRERCQCQHIEDDLRAYLKPLDSKSTLSITCLNIYHASDECLRLSAELEAEEEEDPDRERLSHGHGKACVDDQITVNITAEAQGYGPPLHHSKCFPSPCSCAHIRKDFEDLAGARSPPLKMTISCG